MKRSLAKLKQTAALRFPADPAKQAAYLRQVKDAADRVDDAHYWISPQAWRDLKARIEADHGPRPRLPRVPAERQVFTAPSPRREIFEPKGPGSHLHDIIVERLKVAPTASCGCESMIAQMDEWGADGCREHRSEIIAHLVGQGDQLQGVKRLALKLPGGKYVARKVAEAMLDEAIERAEAWEVYAAEIAER